MALRWIDAGVVSGLRSQSIYHGLAHARTPDTPDTIVVLTPGDPYVSIGLHQTLRHELDVDACASLGLPIIRRECGGGAVSLDSDQLFMQWIFGPEQLPLRVDRRFELFTRPMIRTLRRIGVEARFRPPNDIHVDGKKITGTGAARIGNAEVLVGNFLFDFDPDRMTRILNARSPELRSQIRDSLDRYLTTLTRELGEPPSREEVRAAYREEVAAVLGETLTPGEPTPEELAWIETLDGRLSSVEFRESGGGLHRPGVKIHQDVYVAETRREIPGGRIRVIATRHQQRLDDVTLRVEGDADDDGDWSALASALRGAPLEERALTGIVSDHLSRREGSRITVGDWVAALLGLLETVEPADRDF